MKARLIIFVRAPREGDVKTRLAGMIGSKGALEAYKRLVHHLFNNLAALRNVELRFTPDDAGSEISSWLRSGWGLRPQGDGDLGSRLTRAFQETFDEGCERVVIIGSDCPAVEADDIEAGWAALAEEDVVVGPAQDGGYWLIGLRQTKADLFQDVAWGTAKVLETTLRRIHANGLTVRCLQILADIDTVHDWQEYLAAEKDTPCGVAANRTESAL